MGERERFGKGERDLGREEDLRGEREIWGEGERFWERERFGERERSTFDVTHLTTENSRRRRVFASLSTNKITTRFK